MAAPWRTTAAAAGGAAATVTACCAAAYRYTSQPQPESELHPDSAAAPGPVPALPPPLTVIVTTSPCRGGAAVHQALLLELFASFRHIQGLQVTPTPAEPAATDLACLCLTAFLSFALAATERPGDPDM